MSRPFNTSQPLGKIMKDAGLSVSEVEAITGISYRTISDYLAGRKAIIPRHARLLMDLFDVSWDALHQDDAEEHGDG